MLVLTRYMEEFIIIGDDVEVTVLGVNGSTVKPGVSAPRDLSIHRPEVYEKFNLPSAQSLISDEAV